MEEKKKIKLSLKIAIVLVIIFIIIMVGFIIIMININKRQLVNEVLVSTNPNGYESVEIDEKVYYKKTSNKTWNGIYNQSIFYTVKPVNSVMKVVSYEKYKEIVKSIKSASNYKIEPYYLNKNNNYIVLAYANGYKSYKMNLLDCLEENNKIIIYGNEEVDNFNTDKYGYIIAIPTNLPEGTEIEYRECYNDTQIDNIEKYGRPENRININDGLTRIEKPIIYLYPTEETDVSVKLLKSENLICSYPKYQGGWNVIAEPNGDLKDLTTNRNLYSLYYESKSDINFKVENEGFVIKGGDSAKFLEEKLAILGLNEKEAEEFIVYWLPRLEANKYNYIRFATLDEINENMPLEINPNPDSIIRIMMTFKGLDNPIDVKEQELVTPERNGFVAVEWGGTEIK